MSLPCHDFIHDLPLFGGGTTQIDARCLDAFMSHQVGKQGDVIELVEELLGETMMSIFVQMVYNPL